MNEVIIGVLASLIATVITSRYYAIKYRIEHQDKLIKTLGINPDVQVRICFGNIQDSKKYKSPISGIIPTVSFDYGDADSILLVYDKFRRHFRGKTRWIRNEIPIPLKNGNIVSIAGPKWNKTTEQLIGEIGSPLYYSNSVHGLIEKRINHNRENIHKFSFERDDDSIEVEDYGCLICAKNNVLGNDISSALIVSGYTTYGTLFAAEALHAMTREEIRDLSRSVRGDDKFAIVVKGTISLDLSGRIASAVKVDVVTWIGERDFHPSYHYKY